MGRYPWAVLLAESWIERNSSVVNLIEMLAIGIIGWWLLWYFRGKDKYSKHLDYRVLDEVRILSGSDRPEKLKVIYGNREVIDPHIRQVRFKNTGNQPIDDTDFMQRPYEIVLPNVQLLDYAVIEESAPDLVNDIAEVIRSGKDARHTVSIAPNTLNAGDWFTVQLVYDFGPSADPPTVIGRIRGQTRPSQTYATDEELRATRYAGDESLITVNTMMTALILFFMLTVVFARGSDIITLPIISMTGFMTLTVVCFGAVRIYTRTRRKQETL